MAKVTKELMMEKFKEFSELYDKPIEEIMKLFKEIYSSIDLSIISNEEELFYAILGKVRIILMNTPKTEEITFIPLGIDEVRTFKSGKKMSSIYGIMVDKFDNRKFIKIIGRDENANFYEGIELFLKYKVNIAKYNEICEFVNGSNFSDPEPIDIEPQELLKDFPIVELKDIANDIVNGENKTLSRKGSDGYVIDTDWRGIKGIISRKIIKERKDGRTISLYTIIDPLWAEEIVLPEREKPIGPEFTIWCPKSLMKFEKYDECLFFGTITDDFSMNCYCIVPLMIFSGE